MLVGSDLQVAKSRSDCSKNDYKVAHTHPMHAGKNKEKVPSNECAFNTMKKGYKEMAAINLALSNYCFQAESEVQSYYDRIAECEEKCK